MNGLTRCLGAAIAAALVHPSITSPLPVTFIVSSLNPAPGSSVTSRPSSVTATLNGNVNPLSANPSTCHLLRPGPDGVFGTADDITVSPTTVSVVGGNQIQMDFPPSSLPNDTYQVVLSGAQIGSTGLVAHWEFNEGNGTTLSDASGNGNTGTLSGPLWAQGKVGGALRFNGNQDRVLIGKAGISPPWTAAMWVHGQPTTDTAATLMDPQIVLGNCGIRYEQFNTTRKLGVTRYGATDYVFNVPAPYNAWAHLTYVGTASATSVYVNGVFADSTPNVIEVPMNCLGSVGSQSFVGLMGDACVYNRALSVSEIQALAGYPGALLDSSGNVLDGEFSGTFPSGNGVAGGDFVAQFTITAPPPPPAPSNLVAQGGNGQVSLIWTGSSGATSYNVKRGNASGSEVMIATGIVALQYTDSGLTNGMTFYYVVTAVNGGGESSPSNEVLAVPVASGPAIGTDITVGGYCGASGLELLIPLMALFMLRKARRSLMHPRH